MSQPTELQIESAACIAFAHAVERGFPYYSYSDGRKLEEFAKICDFDLTKVIRDGIVRQTMHGLGLAWSYFPHAWSVKSRKMKTPTEVFEDKDLFKKAITRRLKRGGYEMLREDGSMTDSQIRKSLRSYSGVQSVSNFRPTAAGAIYNRYGGGVVWDMSCGFGGRMLGAMACGTVKKYIGTDPSTPTYDGLCKMRDDFSHLGISVELNKIGSELFVPSESVDICFTSPPYYDTEKYTDEDTQSWKSYSSIEEWNDKFLLSTIKNCHSCLRPGGVMAINVANVASHQNLENDTVKLAIKAGFTSVETLKLHLSSINKGGFKSEPIFVFQKL